MPVAIRANSAQRHTGRVSAVVCACLMVTVSAATAQNAVGGIPATARDMITRVPWHDVAGLALTLGVVLFAVIALFYVLESSIFGRSSSVDRVPISPGEGTTFSLQLRSAYIHDYNQVRSSPSEGTTFRVKLRSG